MNLFDEVDFDQRQGTAAEADMNGTAADENMSYEAMEQRLNAIAQRLESEQLPLNVATALYAEGMTLAGKCHAMLTEAQLQVQEIPVPGIGGSDNG